MFKIIFIIFLLYFIVSCSNESNEKNIDASDTGFSILLDEEFDNNKIDFIINSNIWEK